MQGFFTKKEIEHTSQTKGKTLSCVSCGLYKDCNTPKMPPYGNFKKGILNIGIASSKADDKIGKPFQGGVGYLLQKAYKKIGVDLFEDCLNIMAVNCYVDDAPTSLQIECCRGRVLKIIEEYKPKIIVLFGMSPIQSVIGTRWKKDIGTITKWRGWQIPDQDLQAWICPTYDINFVIERNGGVEETIWENDFKEIKKLLTKPFPIYKEPEIEYIEDLSILQDIKHYFAFDYETTGIKPHAEGHRIICCSIADREDHVFVFMMPKTKKELSPFLSLLENEAIGKVAQNMKFEHTWTKVRLRTEVKGWLWDTMLATHILDNRPGITGLKFQTYVQFGIIDYASDIEPYLKAPTEDTSNAINRIQELVETSVGRKKLMKYCALDSIFELRLANLQREEIILPF